MSGSRKEVSPRTRFEVFKRDKFTCQYCGRKAPEVVLNCDHIQPVSQGGGNDILNLLTSCQACNGGKGAVPLSDDTAVAKQAAMLEELEDRRQQLEMMMKWRDELAGLSSDTVEMVVQRIAARTPNMVPNEHGKLDIKRWLKRFTFEEVVRAVDEAFDTYLNYRGDEVDEASWNKAFSKIPGVASIIRQEAEKPYLRRLLYIQGIIRKRSRAYRYDCIEYLEHLHLCGADLDDMEKRAKRIADISDFEGPYDEWLTRLGRPF